MERKSSFMLEIKLSLFLVLSNAVVVLKFFLDIFELVCYFLVNLFCQFRKFNSG